MNLCEDCQRPTDSLVTDGEHVLCRECASDRATVVYRRLATAFNAYDELTRKAFAVYGNDDFWNLVNEEIDNG